MEKFNQLTIALEIKSKTPITKAFLEELRDDIELRQDCSKLNGLDITFVDYAAGPRTLR